MAGFGALIWPKLISRKTWDAEKSWIFHVVYFQFGCPGLYRVRYSHGKISKVDGCCLETMHFWLQIRVANTHDCLLEDWSTNSWKCKQIFENWKKKNSSNKQNSNFKHISTYHYKTDLQELSSTFLKGFGMAFSSWLVLLLLLLLLFVYWSLQIHKEGS